VRVLATGGPGYVGGELVDQRAWAGHEVQAPRRPASRDKRMSPAESPRSTCRSVGRISGIRPHRSKCSRRRGGRAPCCDRRGPSMCPEPELLHAVNVQATHALVAGMRAAVVERLISASTCSNYGRMAIQPSRSRPATCSRCRSRPRRSQSSARSSNARRTDRPPPASGSDRLWRRATYVLRPHSQ
jgi:hypothetical protein